jgi:hypothetical protein
VDSIRCFDEMITEKIIAVICNPVSCGDVVKRTVVYDIKDGAAYRTFGDTKSQ